ncbi:MAG: TonB-dependent receptor [Candidatus Marinimicrobia bacterium]|nr:TonB-dependent receptor [Candidatus Neomarinimicrobiota bacterium]
MKRLFVFSVLLLLIVSPLWAGNISGYVVDQETGETIIGVNVMVEGNGQGAATDVKGFFIIRNLVEGQHTLRFSHIAYREYFGNYLMSGTDIFIPEIALTPHSIETEAVEVLGQRGSIIQKDMDISSFEVDPIVLTEIPQLSKDVFQLMKLSPSVTISDPFSPQYYVRGSDPGENLVQLDGMTIYNPQHFMGSNAVFNPYAIKNIEMLVGGFDAEYGGRNSSILNISSREGHQSEVHGEFRPSISGLSGAIEFPAGKDATAMVSGRILTDITMQVMMGSGNIMMDFNGAYQKSIGKTKLRLSGFYARDYMDYVIDDLMIFFPDSIFEDFSEGFITNTSNNALGIQSSTVLTPNLLFETHLYYSGSDVDNKTYFRYSFEDTTSATDVALNYKTRIENSIDDMTVKANLAWFTFRNQSVKLGLEINRLRFSNRLGSFELESKRSTYFTSFQAFYLQDKIEIGKLLFKIGMRNSRDIKSGAWRREPRVSATLKLMDLTFKLAYGHYYQYLTTMDSKNNEFVQFIEYYNTLKGYDPMHSVHHILGVEGKITERLDYSLTAYYKDLRNLYHYSYESGNGSNRIEQGSGESYGFEILFRGEIGKLSGWVGYTYSHGSRNYPSVLNGKTTLFDGDQPHNFKSVLLYKLTGDITASSTFQFSSGFPKTWETGMLMHYYYDPLWNGLGASPTSITPTKNNVRYPSRLTWDIGWKKKLRQGFGYYLAEYLGAEDAVFFMTIRNLLFLHRDPQYYFYFPDYGYYGFDFDFIPSISAGYSIRF